MLFHLLLLLLLIPLLDQDLARIPRAALPLDLSRSGSRGGGGDRSAGYIWLPATRPSTGVATRGAEPPIAPPITVSPPASLPVPSTLPEPESVTSASAVPAGGDSSGTGPGGEGGAGGGLGTGPGTGAGSGEGPGVGSQGGTKRGTPPQAKQIILPPEDRPNELRGVSIRVTFQVDSTGRVEQVEVDPEIRNRGYARKFLDVMRQYQFRPARGPDGLPIAGVTTIVVTL